jgi:ribosomal protein S18 acetylase RimI-like enzyme
MHGTQELNAAREDLFQICQQTMPSLLSGAPALIVRRKEGATLAISGEPVSWSNWLFITSEKAPSDLFQYFVETTTKLRLPSAIVCISNLEADLRPALQMAGYRQVSGPVFMRLLSKPSFPPAKTYTLEQVVDASMNDALVNIVKSAVGPPLEPLKRLLDPSLLASKNIEVFLALHNGLPVATVTTLIAEGTAGIWRLVTLPEYQRQGIGHSVLRQVIELYRGRSIDRFYLIANSIGRRLYERLGFVQTHSLSQWVR